MSFDLAECCVFVKQSVDPFHCDPLLSASSRKEFSIVDCGLPIVKSARLRATKSIENRKSKICNSSFLLAAKRRGHPFFRSYGARLPSSLTRFHSRALVYSTHPPVSVYGTGNRGNTRWLFLAPVLTDPLQPKPPRPCPCGQTATFNRRTVSTDAHHLA